jgi:putative membrane protein
VTGYLEKAGILMLQARPRLSGTRCLIGVLAAGLAAACGDDSDNLRSSTGALTPDAGRTAAPDAGGLRGRDAGSPDAGFRDAGSNPLLDAGTMRGTDAGDAGAVLALDDGQILYAADSLNEGEINEARAALPKLSNGDVRDFAAAMIADHGAARDQLTQLAEDQSIAPASSDVANELQAKSRSTVADLLAADPASIDALYVEQELSGHIAAATLLDELIAAADSEPLRAELTDLRATVQTHLDRVRALSDADR